MMSPFSPGSVLGQLGDDPADFHWTVFEEAPRLERDRDRLQLRWLRALILLAVALLGSRLLFLQVTQGGSNRLLAEGNRIRNQRIAPSRGVITDRAGTILARTVAAFGLELVPASLPKAKADREVIYALAASLSDTSIEAIQLLVGQQGLRSPSPILLVDHLSHEQALLAKIRIGSRPGLAVVDRPERQYTEAPGLGHVLGYTGAIAPDELERSADYSLGSETGKTGVEQTYEGLLQGKPGIEQVEVDSRGYQQRVVGQQAPISGDTVVLGIDLALQRRLGEALQKQLDEVGSTSGVAIIMDPRDGLIRALVSLPDYRNNEFATGISPDRYQELLSDPRSLFSNRAVAGQYPSGSVIKPVVAAGGLADGVISEGTTIDAPASIAVGDFVFPDWKRHGLVDVKRALAVSSNVFFYSVGGGWESIRGLGIERLNHYFELFGFGRTTGIDLPGEAAGLVPTPEWKQRVKGEPWYLGDTYHASIGQGDFLVTPIQLLVATATIANGGTIQTPHLLLADQPVDGQAGIGPPGARGPLGIDDQRLAVVRAGMRQGVTDGSSRLLQSLPVPLAGKTGTAQFGSEGKTHAWWTGFAPYDHPELVMTVFLEGAGAGNEVAVPLVRDVLGWYYARPAEERL